MSLAMRKSPERFVRDTYLDYFERLRKIGNEIVALRREASTLPEAQKAVIESRVSMLEKEILSFSRNLEESGIDVLERV